MTLLRTRNSTLLSADVNVRVSFTSRLLDLIPASFWLCFQANLIWSAGSGNAPAVDEEQAQD